MLNLPWTMERIQVLDEYVKTARTPGVQPDERISEREFLHKNDDVEGTELTFKCWLLSWTEFQSRSTVRPHEQA